MRTYKFSALYAKFSKFVTHYTKNVICSIIFYKNNGRYDYEVKKNSPFSFPYFLAEKIKYKKTIPKNRRGQWVCQILYLAAKDRVPLCESGILLSLLLPMYCPFLILSKI
jgi:hypothetical protein